MNIKKIIEKEDINICDIYLNIFQEEYLIKSFKNLRSINCEEEIQQTNLLNQLIKEDMNNLKYINLNLGDIDLSILYEMIKKCYNLKSLILKLHPNNFNQNINLLLQLIENLKQLKIINIISNNSNFKYDICLTQQLNNCPKTKERKYYCDKFIIGNEVFILRPKWTNNIINFNIKFIYDIKNTNNVKDMSNMFSDCSSLTSLNLSNFNTNKVTNMAYMFCDCSSLVSLELKYFNTNNVKNMSYMFYNCSFLTSLNLSNFNTNNVTNMSWMFYDCSSLTSLNLSNFNTNNVNNMSNMFVGLNKNCTVITLDKNLLEALKN